MLKRGYCILHNGFASTAFFVEYIFNVKTNFLRNFNTWSYVNHLFPNKNGIVVADAIQTDFKWKPLHDINYASVPLVLV